MNLDCDLEATIVDVCAFYRGLGAPRIYQEAGFRKVDWKPYKWSAWLE